MINRFFSTGNPFPFKYSESDSKSEGKPVTVGGEIADGIEIALRHAAEHDGAVCCVGSLYQAGEVLEYFQNKKKA